MNVIGLFMAGPNTGACLFKNGKLVAMAEEERFVRVKTASERFPAASIRYCLKEGDLRLRDVDRIALGWDYSRYPETLKKHMRSIPHRDLDPLADINENIVHLKLSPDLTLFNLKVGLNKIDDGLKAEISWYPHHLCHVASVHYLSGFHDSLVLVVDGSGEEYATTTWHGHGSEIRQIETWKLPHSLGWFYAALTEWLGFKAYSGEGKVMGLAAYGKPDPEVARKLRKICWLDSEAGYKLDPTYVYFGKRSYSKKFTDKLVELLGAPRKPEAELNDYFIGVAYETQKLLEEIATNLVQRLQRQLPGVKKLCISGGVAMNCKMNGVLSNLPKVDEVFINPASHDSGTALGAALLACKESGVSPTQNPLNHAYWGPEYTDKQIKEKLDHCQLAYRISDDIAAETAKLLAENKIVGWFQGRAEFGARALGARSILANPMHPEMKDIINSKVKYREAFRPFAPSMIEEVMDLYMEEPKKSPFMILAYQFKTEFKRLFPSIVHVDGSVRPQTVSKQTNPLYWRLIDHFGALSEHPVILNTSFNIRGEPIVSTPLEAIRCYFSTGMDALAIGSFILEKEPVKSDG